MCAAFPNFIFFKSSEYKIVSNPNFEGIAKLVSESYPWERQKA